MEDFLKLENNQKKNRKQKRLLGSENDYKREYFHDEKVHIIYPSSKGLTRPQRAYMRLPYWAIRATDFKKDRRMNDRRRKVDDATLRKLARRTYMFYVVYLGISPFSKSYYDRTLIHACVRAKKLDMIKELLSFTYSLYSDDEVNEFKQAVQNSGDLRGNNIFHNVFQLEDQKLRDEFLVTMYQ